MGSYNKNNMADKQIKIKEEFELCLEEYRLSDNNSTDDENWDDNETGRTNEIFHISEPLTYREKLRNVEEDYGSEADETFRELTFFDCDEDNDMEIDSDEENQITKAIKDEITEKIKKEMQGD